MQSIQGLYRNAPSWVRLYVRYRIPLFDVDLLACFLPETGSIIDLGCGYGVLANLLATTNPNWRVTGIDLNRKRIEVAQSTVKGRTNIAFQVGDARTGLPQADAIIMTDFLHHLKVPDQNTLLEVVYQKLRLGSSLILLEASTRPFWRSVMSGLSDWILYPFQEKAHFRSPEDMTATMEAIGFQSQIFDRPSAIFAGIGYHCVKADNEKGPAQGVASTGSL